MLKNLSAVFLLLVLTSCNSTDDNVRDMTTIKVATFNVSMDATNYVGRDDEKVNKSVLKTQLRNGHQQIKNIAEIIQRVRPDIILLNEFDYIDDPAQGVELFIKKYLNVAQNESLTSIDYPYYYYHTVNTGKPSPYDLTGDGKATGSQGDAWGFGFFEGHYAMVLLSKYPIDTDNVRTFQNFKWKDMPNALRPVVPSTGEFFYNDEVWAQYPLSSKSHWDIPVNVAGKTIHLLAAHPTPPVFDGPEDRNGSKNHDEVKFWLDYVSQQKSAYIYDDNGVTANLAASQRFIIVGDLNATAVEGQGRKEAISSLLSSPLINDDRIPKSSGGKNNRAKNLHAKNHTAYWGARADYVLPSRFGFSVIDNGIFWPEKNSANHRLIKDRMSSSDHRMVWSTLLIK